MDVVGLAATVGIARGTHACWTEIDDAIPVGWLLLPLTFEWLFGDERWLS